MKRRHNPLHRAAPRPSTISDDGRQAICLCGRPVVHVEDQEFQQGHWRHNPRREALR